MSEEFISIASKIVGITITCIYVLVFALLLVRYFSTAFQSQAEKRLCFTQSTATGVWQKICFVFFAFICSRLFYFLITLVYAAICGQVSQYLNDIFGYWVRWDAHHYIGLIQNWYVNEGDPRFHIVFYPLFPTLGRALAFIGISARASGFIVSNICFVISAWALYELTSMSHGSNTGKRAVWLMVFCPLSFFFSSPFSESSFMMTTLLAVLFARKRRFALAVIFGALSAYARSLGIAVAIPIFWELLRDMRDKNTDKIPLRVSVCIAKVLPVALGLVAYLLLNWKVTGNPFQFLIYQSEHWGQEFGSLYNTVLYTLKNALTYDDINYRLGVWWPQFIAIVTSLSVLAYTWRKQHPGDAAYGIAYYYCACAPTWLLSGARYMAGMYSLYPALALITKRRWQFITVIVIELILGAYMAIMYANIGAVM